MTKDEALRLALEALGWTDEWRPQGLKEEAITAIKVALSGEAQTRSVDKDEPVAWKWHQAPVKTSWGDGMVVADLAIDKDHTASIYCERDQTAKVEAMFITPQQEAKDEPDWKALVLNHNADCESRCDMDRCGYKPYFEHNKRRCPDCPVHERIDVEYTPPQRTWVGLTNDEVNDFAAGCHLGNSVQGAIYKAEAKLKEKNGI